MTLGPQWVFYPIFVYHKIMIVLYIDVTLNLLYLIIAFYVSKLNSSTEIECEVNILFIFT
jgi:hypothetical protein